jgi:5-methylcytosine-specific restriction endonuclease McrA
MSGHTCPACGRVFDTSRGLGVHHSAVHGTKLPNRECSHCGREFHCEHEKKYCSEECLDKTVSYEGEANPNYRGGKETAKCELCGSEFEYYPSDKNALYCSDCVKTEPWRYRPSIKGPDHPRWKGGKREVECEVCDATIKRYPSSITGEVTVCSEKCRSKWLSEEFVGSGHPNWKGGIKVPYGKGWNATRRQALERDSYQCRVCLKSKEEIGRNPDVHHITPLRLFIESEEHEKEDAHFLENVISLCVTCHRRADVGTIPKERLYSLIEIQTSDTT